MDTTHCWLVIVCGRRVFACMGSPPLLSSSCGPAVMLHHHHGQAWHGRPELHRVQLHGWSLDRFRTAPMPLYCAVLMFVAGCGLAQHQGGCEPVRNTALQGGRGRREGGHADAGSTKWRAPNQKSHNGRAATGGQCKARCLKNLGAWCLARQRLPLPITIYKLACWQHRSRPSSLPHASATKSKSTTGCRAHTTLAHTCAHRACVCVQAQI